MNIEISEVRGLDDIHHHRKWLYDRVNEHRVTKFNQDEKIFELQRGESLPFPSSPLPESDQYRIAMDNALDAWQPAMWDCFREGSLMPIAENSDLDPEEPDYTATCLDQKFMWLEGGELEDDRITVGNIELIFKNPHPDAEFQLEKGYKFRYGDLTIEQLVETTPDSDATKGNLRKASRSLKSASSDQIEIAYTLTVASGGLDVMQIEVSPDSDTFPRLFERLNLNYELVKEYENLNIYLISNSERAQNRVANYLSLDEPTMEEYIELLGYPEEIMYFIENGTDKYQFGYDRYSSEEVALQLHRNEEIDVSELQAFLLCPYRPPPEPKQAKYAIQLGQQVKNALVDFQQVSKDIEVANLIEQYERHHMAARGREKPVFPVTEWPLQTDT